MLTVSYKINNPTVLARVSHDELAALFTGYGYEPFFVEGSDRASMHQAMAATMEECVTKIRSYQKQARDSGKAFRPRWPMIVLRSPKGWTAPRDVDGHFLEGFWRAHQIPLPDVAKNEKHLKLLEDWMKSYRPGQLFDENGQPSAEIKELVPVGNARMSANPVANGGYPRSDLTLPTFKDYGIEVKHGVTAVSGMSNMGKWLRDVVAKNPKTFRLFGPDETESNKLAAVYEAVKRSGWATTFLRMRTEATSR